MLRFTTAGESHGRALVAIVEGLPAGVPVDVAQIDAELKRRQWGYGRGGRMKIEQDHVEILSHVIQVGGIPYPSLELSWEEIAAIPEEAPLRCGDTKAQQRMIELIDRTREAGDTIGGVFEVVARGFVPGLGSHTSWDKK